MEVEVGKRGEEGEGRGKGRGERRGRGSGERDRERKGMGKRERGNKAVLLVSHPFDSCFSSWLVIQETFTDIHIPKFNPIIGLLKTQL